MVSERSMVTRVHLSLMSDKGLISAILNVLRGQNKGQGLLMLLSTG
ncbi:hypothetical protein ES703_43296 [subsurface metagenome]